MGVTTSCLQVDPKSPWTGSLRCSSCLQTSDVEVMISPSEQQDGEGLEGTSTSSSANAHGVSRCRTVRLLDSLPMCSIVGCSFEFLLEFAKIHIGLDLRGTRVKSNGSKLAKSHEEKGPQGPQNTARMTMGEVCNNIIKPLTKTKRGFIQAMASSGFQGLDTLAGPTPLDDESDSWDQEHYLSYADMCLSLNMRDCRGKCAFQKATHFVSHAWGYALCSFVSAISAWIDGLRPDDDREGIYLWIDAFVVNQHQTQNYPQEWWSSRFMQAVGEIGNTVLILEPWQEPVPLKRAWVIWELYCTTVTGARLHFALKPETMDSFQNALVESFEQVQTGLSKVDVSKSEAFHMSDQDMIHTEIKRTIGFTRLNELVQTRLMQWLVVQAKKYLTELQAVNSKTPKALENRFRLHDNLARMMREYGNVMEAELLFRSLLAELEDTRGKEHNSVLMCLNQLAVTLQKRGKPEEALNMHRDCLRRRQRSLGEEHADTLQSASNLAVLLSHKDGLTSEDFEEAKRYFEMAIAKRKVMLGSDHPSTLYTVSNLGRLLSYAPTPSMEYFKQAEGIHETAVVQLSMKIGHSHPLTLTAKYNQACDWQERTKLLIFNNESEEAERFLSKAVVAMQGVLQMRTEKLGEEHRDTIACANQLRVMKNFCMKEQASASWKELSLATYKEMRTADQFRKARLAVRKYGVFKVRDELIQDGWVDRDTGRLTTDMQPFNRYARIADGKMLQANMASEQLKLKHFQDRYVIVCNQAEADDHWDCQDPAWIGKASMSKRHVLLVLKDLHWEWFNVLTFGLASNLPAGLAMLEEMREAAHLWTSESPDWPPQERVGLYLQTYAHCTVPAFHLHIVDMDVRGPTFGVLDYKNLSVDDAISILREEIAAARG
mmetsp:Transcript_95566/g.270374  ORF Transcript_95566/g.270374 Transcript_95566/m.270374 type:complete len:886 (+) Transcript_95566:109-2766(+)